MFALVFPGERRDQRSDADAQCGGEPARGLETTTVDLRVLAAREIPRADASRRCQSDSAHTLHGANLS
jgi:hypothetical protein